MLSKGSQFNMHAHLFLTLKALPKWLTENILYADLLQKISDFID